MTETSYIFVIDTDSYAGNFERSMCAYLTGRVGECGVGGDEAELFNKETGVDKYDDRYWYVNSQMGDDGCRRPCEMMVNGDSKYHSVGIFMTCKPPDEDVELFKDRANKFCEYMKTRKDKCMREKIKLLGFRLITKETTVSEKVINV